MTNTKMRKFGDVYMSGMIVTFVKNSKDCCCYSIL